MRLTKKLVHVAALLAAAGCGSSGGGQSDAGTNCGPCGCNTAMPQTHDISAAQACSMLDQDLSQVVYGTTCSSICQGEGCELPAAFFKEVQAMNPDAGIGLDPDGGRTIACPTSSSMVTVTCVVNCTGRRTLGCAPPVAPGSTVGEQLATMAYLEAVSVHAFARLERELQAHGAPPAMLRGARRARRDEVRHTAMTTRLARRRGGQPRMPEAPREVAVRPLFDVALENAVEGCVRETYGAVQGLVEAQVSHDRALRRAMQSIAQDECRHAELAWAVHAWAMARLSAPERERVRTAMRAAIEELARTDARGTGLLFEALPLAA